MLTGFGPFMTVYLAASGWDAQDIGFALSVATIASVVGQVPAGLVMDAVPNKRPMAAIAIIGIMAAALGLALFPTRWPVLGAEALQGVSAALLTPAIAAMTLALCNQSQLGERLGSNVRFQALGSMSAALLMGTSALMRNPARSCSLRRGLACSPSARCCSSAAAISIPAFTVPSTSPSHPVTSAGARSGGEASYGAIRGC